MANRLDAVFNQQNKAMHDHVSQADAQRVIARTYF